MDNQFAIVFGMALIAALASPAGGAFVIRLGRENSALSQSGTENGSIFAAASGRTGTAS